MAKKKTAQPDRLTLLQLHHRQPDGQLIRYEQRLKGCDVHRWVADYLKLVPFGMGDSLMVLAEDHDYFITTAKAKGA